MQQVHGLLFFNAQRLMQWFNLFIAQRNKLDILKISNSKLVSSAMHWNATTWWVSYCMHCNGTAGTAKCFCYALQCNKCLVCYSSMHNCHIVCVQCNAKTKILAFQCTSEWVSSGIVNSLCYSLLGYYELGMRMLAHVIFSLHNVIMTSMQCNAKVHAVSPFITEINKLVVVCNAMRKHICLYVIFSMQKGLLHHLCNAITTTG